MPLFPPNKKRREEPASCFFFLSCLGVIKFPVKIFCELRGGLAKIESSESDTLSLLMSITPCRLVPSSTLITEEPSPLAFVGLRRVVSRCAPAGTLLRSFTWPAPELPAPERVCLGKCDLRLLGFCFDGVGLTVLGRFGLLFGLRV